MATKKKKKKKERSYSRGQNWRLVGFRRLLPDNFESGFAGEPPPRDTRSGTALFSRFSVSIKYSMVAEISMISMSSAARVTRSLLEIHQLSAGGHGFHHATCSRNLVYCCLDDLSLSLSLSLSIYLSIYLCSIPDSFSTTTRIVFNSRRRLEFMWERTSVIRDRSFRIRVRDV